MIGIIGFQSKDLTFAWDDEKNESNKRKHGISFSIACRVFQDKHRLERFDGQHSIDEERYISIGMVKDILFVVHTDRGDNIRIISARLATKAEREEYYGQAGY